MLPTGAQPANAVCCSTLRSTLYPAISDKDPIDQDFISSWNRGALNRDDKALREWSVTCPQPNCPLPDMTSGVFVGRKMRNIVSVRKRRRLQSALRKRKSAKPATGMPVPTLARMEHTRTP